MSNTPAPTNAPAPNVPKTGPSYMGWAIGISVVVVIALIIYLIVQASNACEAKNDEAKKKGPGQLKCDSGDTGPVPKCGNWKCAMSCAKSYNPMYTETPLNTDFCQGMNTLTKKLETLPKKFYDAK